MHIKPRIKTLILMGFSVVIAIMVALTAIWLTHINANQALFEHFLNDQKKTELVFIMRDAANQRALSLYRMSILTDPFEQDDEYLHFRSQAERFIKARLGLVDLNQTEDELDAWRRAQPFVQQGTKSQTLVANLIADGEIVKANELMANTVIPIQNNVLKHLTEMLDMQKEHVASNIINITLKNQAVYKQVATLGAIAIIIGSLVALFVIRSSVKTERDLIQARHEAQEANTLKSSFLANMSHELRTPLNAIIGYSEMLEEEAQDLGGQSFASDLGKIRASGLHLLTLIDDILDLSKIEANKMEVFPENFAIKNLVTEVVDTIQPLLTANQNELTVSFADDIGDIFADQIKVRQTLFNLLSNACKFTTHGSIHLRVSAYLHNGQDWIKIEVQDSGIGMRQEQLQKLFAPFTQADVSTTRNYGGTGLGLTISRHFCYLMGGDLRVYSEEGKGSTFIITLPRNSSNQQREAVYKQSIYSKAARSASR